MYNYINVEKLFVWYDSVAKNAQSHDKLLAELTEQYMNTRRSTYVISAGKTVSCKEESYPFRFENIGCCGASTMFFCF